MTSPRTSAAPCRIWITGSSAAGKSTLARRWARQLDLHHLELDGLYHQAGWTPADPDVMRAQVAAVLAEPRWVVDGNYRSVLGTLVAERCDLRVVLGLPIHRIMARVVRRTLGRVLLRTELWNGNREQWRALRSLDPHENIVLWAWSQRRAYRAQADDALAEAAAGGPPTVVLRSPAQMRRFTRYLQRWRAAAAVSSRRSAGPS